MEIQEHTLKILKASEGKFLTQVAETLQEHESRLYVKQITVTDATINNYREATLEEKEAYEAEQNKTYQMDKLVHFLFGIVIALSVGLFTAPYIGLIAAVLAGVAKEIYDIKRTKFNILDFVYTAFGGCLGVLILYLLNNGRILKALWIVIVSAIMAMISYFEPVINMIIAITIIFVVDIIFGIASGKKLNKEPVSFKKGFAAIKLFGIYIFVITLLYAIGKFMCDETLILYVVKTISWVAIYFYITNLTKNLKRLYPNSQCIKFIHWFLSVEFLDNIPSLKKFLEKI